ncbi:hypothetical protein CMUS01_06392 [Colletotrichum musicola]|uniref:Uncharacterized protein n=1 Tax=Colletotrichum musicola TaxID=2175873 RepID=A0A8H6KLU3_9PEZI|nr:hypothetical protein CMUS01_06392 [Colletotrichum musicola]
MAAALQGPDAQKEKGADRGRATPTPNPALSCPVPGRCCLAFSPWLQENNVTDGSRDLAAMGVIDEKPRKASLRLGTPSHPFARRVRSCLRQLPRRGASQASVRLLEPREVLNNSSIRDPAPLLRSTHLHYSQASDARLLTLRLSTRRVCRGSEFALFLHAVVQCPPAHAASSGFSGSQSTSDGNRRAGSPQSACMTPSRVPEGACCAPNHTTSQSVRLRGPLDAPRDACLS